MVGPQGPDGFPGEQGSTGDAGRPGNNGEKGIKGQRGAPGVVGLTGLRGETAKIDDLALEGLIADMLNDELKKLDEPKCRHILPDDEVCEKCPHRDPTAFDDPSYVSPQK